MQFNRQNWGDKIRILEEHPNPLPRYKRCWRQFPVGRLKICHYMSEKCKRGEERRLKHETLKFYFEGNRVSFHIKK